MYEYLPGDDFIRLLYVPLLESAHDKVCYSMRIVPMKGDVAYVALSYSCGMDGSGDASISRRIVVENCTLGIGQNLFEGLRQIFSMEDNELPILPIWIDAVCIDQTNVEERNAQVARMAQVYADATKVYVWLGEGDYTEDNARVETMLDCLGQSRHVHYREHRVVRPDGGAVDLCLAHAGIAAHAAVQNCLRTSIAYLDCSTQPQSKSGMRSATIPCSMPYLRGVLICASHSRSLKERQCWGLVASTPQAD